MKMARKKQTLEYKPKEKKEKSELTSIRKSKNSDEGIAVYHE